MYWATFLTVACQESKNAGKDVTTDGVHEAERELPYPVQTLFIRVDEQLTGGGHKPGFGFTTLPLPPAT